jgi:hypothetical protein
MKRSGREFDQYPFTVAGTDASPALRELIESVAADLLSEESPSHAVLRAQLNGAVIDEIEFTGVGLFARFACSDSTPRLPIPRAIGGSVSIELEGLKHGAGSVMCVTDGKIDFLEIYTQAGEVWPQEPEVLSTTLLLPLQLGEHAA